MAAQIKKVLKVIVSLVLCMAMLMTLGVSIAQAKSKRGKLTVTYRGKTIVLMTTKTDKKNAKTIATANPKAIRKAWKKPSKVKKQSDNIFYTYKKGKSKVSFAQFKEKGWSPFLHGFDISIKDKNFTLCGVKVGMSKTQALKVLKKNFNKNAVKTKKSEINLHFGQYLPVVYELKNNKVKSIRFWTS